MNIVDIVSSTENYNLHSHTQFCDGRDSMEEIALAARNAGMEYWAFTPHSPVPVESSCNMRMSRMDEYLAECSRLKSLHSDVMHVLASQEIDYLGDFWGPHVDYFQKLPIDFRLGSVHFVPNQDGVLIDCDGRFERFSGYLKDGFGNDLRYVVEKYFEQVLNMLERGGLDLLGHFDKIAGNASISDPDIENQGWYESLVDDVINHAVSAGVVIEINTKAFADKSRFYPAEKWWGKLFDAGAVLAVDSDAHYAGKVVSGRMEAYDRLRKFS